MYELFANLTLITHLIFIIFVIFGGLLFFIFPLTYLENWFLYRGGSLTYSNGFIKNYLFPIIYPENLNTNIQIHIGIMLLIFNILVYRIVFKNFRK